MFFSPNFQHIDLISELFTPPPMVKTCLHDNRQLQINETFQDGCTMICTCHITDEFICLPKVCPTMNNTNAEHCVVAPDPKDPCCKKSFCDVTLDDNEQIGVTMQAPALKKELTQKMCEYKGSNYTVGQQFNDACDSFCVCKKDGVLCAKIECPSSFGLDVVDPHCVQWETEPANFRAIAPKCCPDRMRCVNNGSCEYEGQKFDNWAEIPTKLTGNILS